MQSCTKRIVDFLIRKSFAKEECREEYEYFVMVTAGQIVIYATLLLVGIILHIPFLMLTFAFAFSFLRERTGGYHASTWVRCYVTSVCVCMAGCLLVNEWLCGKRLVEIGVILAGGIVIFLFAPVNHPDLRLDDEEYRLCRSYARKRFLLLAGLSFLLSFQTDLQKYATCLVAAIGVNGISIVGSAQELFRRNLRGGHDKMKKISKLLVAVSLAFTMVLSSALPVSAVTHAAGCGAKTSIQKCGSFRVTTNDMHLLHTNVYCTRTAYVFGHYYVCAGCGVETGSGQDKICSRAHTICPTEYNLCK